MFLKFFKNNNKKSLFTFKFWSSFFNKIISSSLLIPLKTRIPAKYTKGLAITKTKKGRLEKSHRNNASKALDNKTGTRPSKLGTNFSFLYKIEAPKTITNNSVITEVYDVARYE